MSTIGTQTITVNSAARAYNPAWVKQYATDIKRGDTATKKCAITNGRSVMRITHNANKGIERHIISCEDRTIDPAADTQSELMEKIQITITCAEDDADAHERLRLLALGFMSWLSEAGVLESVQADEL